MAGKRSQLQMVIDKLEQEQITLNEMITRLIAARDAKPARKPRTPKAKTTAGSATGHGGTA